GAGAAGRDEGGAASLTGRGRGRAGNPHRGPRRRHNPPHPQGEVRLTRGAGVYGAELPAAAKTPGWRWRCWPAGAVPVLRALDSPDVTEDQRTQLPPQYAPGEVEARRYDEWVARDLFTADAGAPAPAYCIVIPPPNV